MNQVTTYETKHGTILNFKTQDHDWLYIKLDDINLFMSGANNGKNLIIVKNLGAPLNVSKEIFKEIVDLWLGRVQ